MAGRAGIFVFGTLVTAGFAISAAHAVGAA